MEVRDLQDHLFPDYIDDIHRGKKASSSSCLVYYQEAQTVIKKKNTHKQQHSYSDVYNREPAWQFPATAPPSKTKATVESQMPTQPNKHALRRSVCNCFSRSSWVREIPWRGERLPTPVFLPGEFHGQSSLAGTVHGVTKNWTQLRDSPFQYSCLENPMDGGACWAIVHGVAKSWTRLSMHAVVLYKSF